MMPKSVLQCAKDALGKDGPCLLGVALPTQVGKKDFSEMGLPMLPTVYVRNLILRAGPIIDGSMTSIHDVPQTIHILKRGSIVVATGNRIHEQKIARGNEDRVLSLGKALSMLEGNDPRKPEPKNMQVLFVFGRSFCSVPYTQDSRDWKKIMKKVLLTTEKRIITHRTRLARITEFSV